MRMDRCNQILLSVSFLILLACYAVSALVQPLPAAVRYTALGVALELALAALMRRVRRNRAKGSTGLFYFKAGIVLFLAVCVLMNTVLLLIR